MKVSYPPDIQCVFKGTDGHGSIFLGNIEAARNIRILRKHSIKAVVSVARGAFLQHSSEELPNYLYIPAEDHEQYDIHTYFDRTYDFLNKNLNHTNILVHCVAGVSRSACIVIAFLMKKEKMKYDDAFRKVSLRRSIINPNKGFIRQLKKFETTLNVPRLSIRTQEKQVARRQRSTYMGTQTTLISSTNSRILGTKRKRKFSVQDQIRQIQKNHLTLQYQIQKLRQRYLKSKKSDLVIQSLSANKKNKSQFSTQKRDNAYGQDSNPESSSKVQFFSAVSFCN